MDERRARFEAQVLPHLDAAYRFARWLSYAPGDADDVVQEAVLRAFRAFDSLRGSDVKAWLLAIVRNCHSTALKQRQRRAFVPLPEEHENVSASEVRRRIAAGEAWEGLVPPAIRERARRIFGAAEGG